jgi:uncharacterized membrane protein YcjF (UPF0283 family)
MKNKKVDSPGSTSTNEQTTKDLSPIQQLLLEDQLDKGAITEWRQEKTSSADNATLPSHEQWSIKEWAIMVVKVGVVIFFLTAIVQSASWWVDLYFKTGSMVNQYLFATVGSAAVIAWILWDILRKLK